MALQVWFREDIGQVLALTMIVAIETSRADNSPNCEHLAGIFTCVKGLSLGFGLPWSVLVAEVRKALDGDASKLLDDTVSRAIVRA